MLYVALVAVLITLLFFIDLPWLRFLVRATRLGRADTPRQARQ